MRELACIAFTERPAHLCATDSVAFRYSGEMAVDLFGSQDLEALLLLVAADIRHFDVVGLKVAADDGLQGDNSCFHCLRER